MIDYVFDKISKKHGSFKIIINSSVV
jgi:hypothetical protein